VVTVLERLGVAVDFPLEQTCCGQMHFNTGYAREAVPLVCDRLGLVSACVQRCPHPGERLAEVLEARREVQTHVPGALRCVVQSAAQGDPAAAHERLGRLVAEPEAGAVKPRQEGRLRRRQAMPGSRAGSSAASQARLASSCARTASSHSPPWTNAASAATGPSGPEWSCWGPSRVTSSRARSDEITTRADLSPATLDALAPT
jgi:hypothetical protein